MATVCEATLDSTYSKKDGGGGECGVSGGVSKRDGEEAAPPRSLTSQLRAKIESDNAFGGSPELPPIVRAREEEANEVLEWCGELEAVRRQLEHHEVARRGAARLEAIGKVRQRAARHPCIVDRAPRRGAVSARVAGDDEPAVNRVGEPPQPA